MRDSGLAPPLSAMFDFSIKGLAFNIKIKHLAFPSQFRLGETRSEGFLNSPTRQNRESILTGSKYYPFPRRESKKRGFQAQVADFYIYTNR